MAGVDILHVPYKGGAASSADLAAGQIQLVITNMPEQVPYITSGRTRALAVSTAKRSARFPDLPTIGETLPGYEVTVWYGICGPGGMAAPLVAKINADLNQALVSPETTQRLSGAGIEPTPGTSAEFRAFAQREIAKWTKVVKDTGISPD
jgi:tripartite-type tricarboxylate transporter receptor subunit TctC